MNQINLMAILYGIKYIFRDLKIQDLSLKKLNGDRLISKN